MGKRNRSLNKEPSLFFVTTTLRDWQPLFSDKAILDIVQKELFALIPGYADALIGYVIMPSHVHFLVGCRLGGLQLSRFMQAFKGIVSRKHFPNTGSIWYYRFDDLVIISEKQFRIKLTYIHDNPVRKGLVKNAEDWEWSSAKFWLLDEENDKLTRTFEWMSDDSNFYINRT